MRERQVEIYEMVDSRVRENDSNAAEINKAIEREKEWNNSTQNNIPAAKIADRNVYCCGVVIVVRKDIMYWMCGMSLDGSIGVYAILCFAWTKMMMMIAVWQCAYVCVLLSASFILLVLLLFLPANDITWNRMICLFLEWYCSQNDSKDHTYDVSLHIIPMNVTHELI